MARALTTRAASCRALGVPPSRPVPAPVRRAVCRTSSLPVEGSHRRGRVSNFIQTLLRLRAYVAAHTEGVLNCETCEYENWTSRAADGERAAAALWWNRTYRF